MTWMHANIAQAVDAPLKSSPADRSGARLALLVAQFRVETTERYRPRDVSGDGLDDTFCNVFACDVANAMGAAIPRGLRANAIHAWLSQYARVAAPGGWETVDAHTAQARADHGYLSVASWANPMKNPDGSARSGHIAILMPSLGEPGVWAAQAGAINFTRELLQRGFGAIAPDFFSHP